MKKYPVGVAVIAFLGALAAQAAVTRQAPVAPARPAAKIPPVQIVADCWPRTSGKSKLAARILSYHGTEDVRALVYSLTDRDSFSVEESHAIREISGTSGPLFSGDGFFLKVSGGKTSVSRVAGLSTHFQGRAVRQRLDCEFYADRAVSARNVLIARSKATRLRLYSQNARMRPAS